VIRIANPTALSGSQVLTYLIICDNWGSLVALCNVLTWLFLHNYVCRIVLAVNTNSDTADVSLNTLSASPAIPILMSLVSSM